MKPNPSDSGNAGAVKRDEDILDGDGGDDDGLDEDVDVVEVDDTIDDNDNDDDDDEWKKTAEEAGSISPSPGPDTLALVGVVLALEGAMDTGEGVEPVADVMFLNGMDGMVLNDPREGDMFMIASKELPIPIFPLLPLLLLPLLLLLLILLWFVVLWLLLLLLPSVVLMVLLVALGTGPSVPVGEPSLLLASDPLAVDDPSFTESPNMIEL